jgi:hypothetical protein
VNRWLVLAVAAAIGLVGGLVLLGLWREAAAVGVTVLGGAAARPVRWRLHLAAAEAQVRRLDRQGSAARIAEREAGSQREREQLRRVADAAMVRRAAAAARARQLRAERGRR